MRRFTPALAVALALFGLGPGPGLDPALGAPSSPAPGQMVVKHSLRNDTSRPLRELAWEAYYRDRGAAPEFGPTRTLPGGQHEDAPLSLPRPAIPAPGAGGGVGTAVSPSPSVSFEGLSNDDNFNVYGGRVMPPDTTGDVGPNHYVQAINLLYRVYDKTGTPLIPPTKMSTLFAGHGNNCEVRNDGDPIVVYDQLADRWLLTQFATPAPSLQCVAVSKTSDPLGQYHRYSWDFGQYFNDYPHFGVWPDAYYASFHLFQSGSYSGLGASAFDRTKMLAGQPATMVFFNAGGAFRGQGHGALPSDLDGTVLPPAGAPNVFVDPNDDQFGGVDRLDLYSFHVDFATPTNSSFEITGTMNMPAFDGELCGFARDCIPQAGTTQRVDALSGRGMYRVYYRNRGGYQQWIGNLTVDHNGPDHAAPLWYEFRDLGNGPRLYQTGVFSPDATHRWMGAIGTDRAGNIALGYSASSATIFPGIRYAVREAADPLGTLQAEATLISGTGSQLGGARWGDYSTMATDPANDCTFWYTQEYGKTTGSFLWYTRIGAFTVPGCTTVLPSADLRISQTVSPHPSQVGTPTTFTATIVNDGPATATGVSVLNALPPSGTTFNSAVPSQGACGAPTSNGLITCALGSISSGASATVAVTVTPTVEGAFVNAAGVTSLNTDSDPADNSSVLTGYAVGVADLSLALNDVDDPVVAGANIRYTATVTNLGPNLGQALIYRQSLPPNTHLLPGSGCTTDGVDVICTKARLANGDAVTFAFSLATSSDTPLVATTKGTITSIVPDPVATNNVKTQKTLVVLPGPPPQP